MCGALIDRRLASAGCFVPRDSDESTLGERHATIITDDAVIEHPDVYQRQCLAEPARDEFVGLTRLGDARRVVVRQDHRRGIAAQSLLDDFAWVHTGTVNGAAK